VEVYTHPDAETEEGRFQLEALCAPELRSALEAADYRLTSTRESTRSTVGALH
jgi:hypothetical protein